MNFRRWADTPWPHVPAAAACYLFLWIAAIHVVASPRPDSMGLGLVGVPYLGWAVLALTSPVASWVAWWMIRHRQGRWRVAGFWVRLGADIGMATTLGSFLLARALLYHGHIPDAPLFAIIALFGILATIMMLIARDIAALVILTQLANRIHRTGDDALG